MTEFEQCTIYSREGDTCEISCRLGLWSVTGSYGTTLIDEAHHYFVQYRNAGEYSGILGGPSVVDLVSGVAK